MAFSICLVFAGHTSWAQPRNNAPAPSSSTPVLRVIVDPGHGGIDDGAKRGKLKEKDIVLGVAKNLVKLLNEDPRFEAHMTRSKDVTVPLSSRSTLAKEKKGDVFISIHVNSSPQSSTVKGAEFYFQSQYPTDDESQVLASRENEALMKSSSAENDKKNEGDLDNILSDLAQNNHIQLSSTLSQDLLDAFEKIMKLRIRAIRQAHFHVLSAVDMPSSLVELGFISTPKEAEWLAQTASQKKMAQALFEGLLKFKEKWDRKKR